MRDKFIKFMYGRYGVDELNKTGAFIAIGLSLLGMFFAALTPRTPTITSLASSIDERMSFLISVSG